MNKAERINSVKNNLTEEELLRVLPEIEMIVDDDIRKKTKKAFLDGCPPYFWVEPTSSSGKYHIPDERGKYGNLIHTKRVFVTYCLLSRTFLEQGLITEHERECGKSAALLHDMLKYGWPSEKGEHTVNNHDIIGAQVAEHIGDLPEEVHLAIHSHNGPWYEGKDPDTDSEQILHLADYVAAKEMLGVPEIIDPVDEITDEFDVPTVGEDAIEDLI